jgi:hypothetical protein
MISIIEGRDKGCQPPFPHSHTSIPAHLHIPTLDLQPFEKGLSVRANTITSRLESET